MRQVSTTYTLTQHLCSDELESGSVRTLKFEVSGVGYDGSDVEIENATLLEMVETDNGDLLSAQSFNHTDALAKKYGGWFLDQLEASDSLRETIEERLAEDYAALTEGDCDRAWKDRVA